MTEAKQKISRNVLQIENEYEKPIDSIYYQFNYKAYLISKRPTIAKIKQITLHRVLKTVQIRIKYIKIRHIKYNRL